MKLQCALVETDFLETADCDQLFRLTVKEGPDERHVFLDPHAAKHLAKVLKKFSKTGKALS